MKTLIKGFCLSLVLLFMFPSLSFAGYSSADQMANDAQGMKVATTIYTVLHDAGYSDAAITGIIANAIEESTLNPGVVNSLGCSGLYQWCFGRATTMKNKVPSWKTDPAGQTKFLVEETPSQLMTGANAPSSKYTSYKPASSVDDFKSFTDYKRATVVWAVDWERPCAGTSQCAGTVTQRLKSADIVKANWSKITGGQAFDSSSSTSPNSSTQPTPDQTRDLPAEQDLVGMPPAWKSPGGTLPELSDGSDLSAAEKKEISIWGDNKSLRQENEQLHLIRAGIMFLGILTILYSVVVLMAWMFDTWFPVTGGKATNLATFGRRTLVTGTELKTDKQITGKGLLGIAFLSAILGALILSGVFTTFVSKYLINLT